MIFLIDFAMRKISFSFFINGIVPQTFPRISTIAERLWSEKVITSDLDEAWIRLDKFRCLLVNRGIPASAFAVPSSCSNEWVPAYKPPY